MFSLLEIIFLALGILVVFILLIFLFKYLLEKFKKKESAHVGVEANKQPLPRVDVEAKKQPLPHSYDDRKLSHPVNEDIEENQNQLIGIENVGETCYLNAIVQAISSSEKLIKSMEKYENDSDKLQKFISVMKNTSNPYADPRSNAYTLAEVVRNCGWTKGSQQDAFDLLSKVISGLEADIINVTGRRDFYLSPKFKLRHENKDNSFNSQKYLGLSLSLCGDYKTKPGVPIEELIMKYFEPVLIDDNPNQESWVKFESEVPDILLLHIQANRYNHDKGIMEKPEYYIQFKEYLQDIKLPTTMRDSLVTYRLTGLVCHSGTVHGGHYVAYRIYNNQWYVMNDSQVNKIDFYNIPKSPYIFVLEKY